MSTLHTEAFIRLDGIELGIWMVRFMWPFFSTEEHFQCHSLLNKKVSDFFRFHYVRISMLGKQPSIQMQYVFNKRSWLFIHVLTFMKAEVHSWQPAGFLGQWKKWSQIEWFSPMSGNYMVIYWSTYNCLGFMWFSSSDHITQVVTRCSN
jgi:hypothetical protein